MQTVQSNGVAKLTGTMIVPGDKSISHRAVMFGSLAHGKTIVNDLLTGDDCLNTIDCFKKLGVDIQLDGNRVEINGKGIEGLEEPSEVLDVGNSGTTIRLLLGILANLPFSTTVIGDASIAKRPMGRVTVPLKQMGAKIDGRNNGEYTPLHIRGGNLKGIEYESPVASAQVKSAILLAGLTAEGETAVVEPEDSRNHTERMLRAFGFDVKEDGLRKSLVGGGSLTATTIDVPGDISSAAFFLVAAAILPGSELLLKNVGMNETRTGIIDVLQAMGAKIEITNVKGEDLEPSADILISHSSLKAIEIGGEIIPRLIDEIPIIALAASQAEGVTVIKDAEELKVKETNRIDAVVEELSQMGIEIEATDDGMKIHGKKGQLQPTNGDSRGDHRIGMMLAIAGLLANGETTIANSDAISISYPGFFEQLEQLRK